MIVDINGYMKTAACAGAASIISNVFSVKDGCWYTPPMECGLLRGVSL